MNDSVGLTKLALLIDGDNISTTFMPLIMWEAAKLGTIAVRRVYGQFSGGRMRSWEKHINEFDLTPVNVTPLIRGKNATDMKLVIEAMDMLYGRQLDGVCVASSDGDFTPLVQRIRGNALATYGFGAKKAPAGYKEVFDRFFECDTLLAAEKKQPAKKTAAPAPPPAAATGRKRKPKPKPKAAPATTERPAAPATPAKEPIPTAAILVAMAAKKRADGWSHQSTVGNMVLKTVPGFSPKKYGYKTMSALIAAIPDIESKADANRAVLIRPKPP